MVGGRRMRAVICLIAWVLAGCSSTGMSVCYYEGMKLSDRMAVAHCEQALARMGNYKTSSQNPYMQPNGSVTIQEQRYGIPTGRTYTVKK